MIWGGEQYPRGVTGLETGATQTPATPAHLSNGAALDRVLLRTGRHPFEVGPVAGTPEYKK